MIGHPDETLEDVQAIADLANAVLKEGRKVHGKAAQVNIGCATFVPKPHTPFQWTSLDSEESIRAKQSLLKQALRKPGLKLSWTEPEHTLLEAFLSRGDRRLGRVILRAWQLGAKLDGWSEHFNIGAWRQAFAEHGLDPEFYTRRLRAKDEVFPWDHIDIGRAQKLFVAGLRDEPAGRDAHGLPRALFRLWHPAHVQFGAHEPDSRSVGMSANSPLPRDEGGVG